MKYIILDMSFWRKIRGLSLKESLDISKLFQSDYDNLPAYTSFNNTSLKDTSQTAGIYSFI